MASAPGGRRGDAREDFVEDARAKRAWIEGFIEAVIEGHSGKTQQLVTAIQAAPRRAVPADLLAELETGSAVTRNRAFRRWLERNKQEAVERWTAFGFPEPPIGYSAAVVLDFDQVISVTEVGTAHLVEAEKRVFGGPERVAQLDELFGTIKNKPGMALAIVSRNSRHVIEKALAMEPFSQNVPGKRGINLLHHFTPGLVFGFEDFSDDTQKSEVIRDKIMKPQGLGQADVLFVDDMMMNICDVRGQCGIQVLHVKGGGGMGAQHCETIRRWVTSVSCEQQR